VRFRHTQCSPPASTKTATKGPEAKRPKATRKFVTSGPGKGIEKQRLFHYKQTNGIRGAQRKAQ